MSLALRLKTTRKKHGLSQSELAKRVDVSQPTIANWERGGHVPRPDALGRIAEALGTDPAWLLSGELPAASNPAHIHLAKPVRHIPVHDWPTDGADPSGTQAVRYISLAMDVTTLFALDAHFSTGFPEGTTLILDKQARETPGRFLVRGEVGYEIVERTSLLDDVLARLVYSVVPH